MHRILFNVMRSDWSVHFIDEDGRTRIGPWLLLDSAEDVLQILRWGGADDATIGEHERDIQRWGSVF